MRMSALQSNHVRTGPHVWTPLADINVAAPVVSKEKIVIKVTAASEKLPHFANIGWGLNCIRKIIKKENQKCSATNIKKRKNMGRWQIKSHINSNSNNSKQQGTIIKKRWFLISNKTVFWPSLFSSTKGHNAAGLKFVERCKLFLCVNFLIINFFTIYLPDINECITNNPCKNGATCVNSVGGYQCLCTPEFSGKHCDQGF